MANQAILQLGTLWISEINHIPVYMESDAGVALTGLLHTDVLIRYARIADGSLQTLVLTAPDWLEKGLGFYMLKVPAAVLNAEGAFELVVNTVAAGNKIFRACGTVETRPEDKAKHYEVFVNVSYAPAVPKLVITVWLQKNGQLVLTPTACRVIIRQEGAGTPVVDMINSSPNTEGYFTFEVNPLTLNTLKVFEVVGKVTFNAVEYTSGNALVTFS